MEKTYKLSDNGSEKRFQKYFVENTKIALPRAEYIDHEFNLINANDVLTSDFRKIVRKDGEEVIVNKMGFGRIDVIFRYKQTVYVAEIKYTGFCNSDFWDALKVIGYTEYYKWQQDSNTKVKPAVMIPAKSVRLEHQIVAGRTGVTIFIISEDKDGYRVKMLDDRPFWKQE